MSENIAVLSKIPKHTPPWAVGLAVIIISAATALISMYVISRTEVVKLIDKKLEYSTQEQDFEIKSNNKVLDTVLGMVATNTKQISELSSALQKTSEYNLKLSERVGMIEKELLIANKKANICEDALRACENKRK